MRYWFTSDPHYGHGRIIEYANRPFKSTDEMNSTLIRNFNARVKPEDTTFIIGDFCFKSGTNCEKAPFWLNQLNGNKIIVRGNHDNNNSTKTIIDCIHITFANTRFNLVHKPEHCNYDFPINLVGHVHQNWKIEKRQLPWLEGTVKETILFNVGVDVNRFMPISVDEILSKINYFKKTGRVK
jgi:calcineurin-like phosphoesterase family protein